MNPGRVRSSGQQRLAIEKIKEEIETFVKEQKSKNTIKKTVSNMKIFQRYLSSNCDENKDCFTSKDALVHRICAVGNDE